MQYTAPSDENGYIQLGNTAISKKAVKKNVRATIPKGNVGYDQHTVRDTVAVELTFDAFFLQSQT